MSLCVPDTILEAVGNLKNKDRHRSILNKTSFAREISGSIFVLGQHSAHILSDKAHIFYSVNFSHNS